VFTHFASPDDDPAFTEEQRRRFLAALAAAARQGAGPPEKLFVHADNSAGLETMPGASPFNAVRVGLLQFGILPHPGSFLAQVRTEPVFSFHTRVGIVKRSPRARPSATGAPARSPATRRSPSCAPGYGDGIPRAVSNRGERADARRPLPGARPGHDGPDVVDVTDVPGRPAATRPSSWAPGRRRDLHREFSRWADTIPWETLCSVTKRVPRVYGRRSGPERRAAPGRLLADPGARNPISLSFCRSRMLRPSKMNAGLDIDA
jgi:alanine racemase